jgi:hypothetical protein
MTPLTCIALDLDRTTLDGQGRLSPGNRAAILQAIHQGIQVVVASGRSYASLPEEIRTLPGLHYAITSNGSAVNRMEDGVALHRWLMPSEQVDVIRRMTRGQGCSFAVFMDGQAYAPAWYLDHLEDYGVTGYGVEYVRTTCRPVTEWEDFLDAHKGELDSFDVMHTDPAVRQKLFPALQEATQGLYFTSSAPHMLEISHGDTGKGNGLRWLMDYLGLSPAQAAAFGDGENDVDLLHAVAYGVAMENATDACKNAAVYVTKAHHEDGVAFALREFFGIG